MTLTDLSTITVRDLQAEFRDHGGRNLVHLIRAMAGVCSETAAIYDTGLHHPAMQVALDRLRAALGDE